MSLDYWERRQVVGDAQYAFANGQEVIARLERIHANAARRIRDMQQRICRRFKARYGLDEDKARELLHSPVGREEYLHLLEEIGRLGKKNPMRDELLAKAAAPAYAYRLRLEEAIELELDAITAKLAEQEQQIVEEHLIKSAQEENMRAAFRIQHKAGVAFKVRGVSEELARVIAYQPWSGASFSSRIWRNREKLAEWMNEDFAGGLVAGESSETLARELAEKMDVSLNRARTLVRTETTHVCNAADFEAYKEAGLEEYLFEAILDKRTSKICRKHDHKRYKVRDKRVGVNCPPMHPNCRSTTITGDFTDEELERMERWARDPVTGKGVKVPASMDYEEWRKLQEETYGEERVAIGEKMARNKAADEKLFRKYKQVLGRKQMPSDLESFQQMKYTEPEEWKRTKRAAYTLSEIDGKSAWSPEFREKAKDTYWTMRAEDVEMSDHAIARYLDRRAKIGDGLTTEQLAQLCKKPVNYIQPDGREVRYYGEVAAVFSEKTGEMVTLLRRKKPREDWSVVRE